MADAWLTRLERIRKNLERLGKCPGPHQFFLTADSAQRPYRKRYQCARCLGEVDGVQRFWYERGLAHGRLHASG